MKLAEPTPAFWQKYDDFIREEIIMREYVLTCLGEELYTRQMSDREAGRINVLYQQKGMTRAGCGRFLSRTAQ